MQHSFDVNIATEYGITESILMNYLQFWILKNKANNDNYNDGYYWTYNSISAFCELFPYLSRKKINNALNRLEEQGIIKTGNYNKQSYDRTKWYTITDAGWSIIQKGKSIIPKGEMECPKKGNGMSQKGKPIPIINTVNKPIIKPIKEIPPSIDEVRAYCNERHNNIDAEVFVDFYESKNWMIGKNKMKDWKACVRTWERRNKESKVKKQVVAGSFDDFHQREYDYEELEQKLLERRGKWK